MANEEFETNQQNANAGDNTEIEKSNSYSADSKQDKQSTNQSVGNMPSPSANATGPDFKGAADKMKSASSTFSGNTQKNSDKNRQPNGDPTGQTFDGQDQSDGSKRRLKMQIVAAQTQVVPVVLVVLQMQSGLPMLHAELLKTLHISIKIMVKATLKIQPET